MDRIREELLVMSSNLVVRALSGACALAALVPSSLAAPAPAERIVVGNRNSGNLSVIDPVLDAVIATVPLPATPLPAETMYLAYSLPDDRLFVGDRRNEVVVVFDAADFSVDGEIPVGEGQFHLWIDPAATLLWVNNELGGSATLIDPETLAVIATLPMPADLVAGGWGPHDVVLSPGADRAYVTMVRSAGPRDFLLVYDTSSLQLLHRIKVGTDAHVALHPTNNHVYVPTLSGHVMVFDTTTFVQLEHIRVPGAHGALFSGSGEYFYATNPQGGATPRITTIDTSTLKFSGNPVDAPFLIPHNMALTGDDSKLYVTHSGGAGTKVSVYSISPVDGRPSLLTSITAGSNPFAVLRIP
jgi:YVTN family beta-propeller protein